LAATDSLGCTGNISQQVTIYPNPVAAFSSNEVCESSATVFTNSSTVPSGSQNSYTWNFGDSNQSSLSHVNHTYNAWGYYTATLTATTQNGCSNTITQQVRVHPKPVVAVNAGVQGCSPVDALFSESSYIAEGTITGWLWNFSDGEVSTDRFTHHVFTKSGTYDATLTVVSDFGCSNSTTLSNAVTVYPQPEADFTADPMVTDMQMPVVNFFNQSQNYASYQWVFSDGTTSTDLNPTHAFGDTGIYTAMLITMSNQGCRDTIMKRIEVKLHSTLFIANTFTPNGDGNNDDFRPFWTNMQEIKVWIFDRWGKLLTSWNDLNGAWDGYYQGRKCQQDTYVYKIQGTGLDGKYSEWVGHVNIVY
jgi:gliding motility-associated-like protein